MKKPIQSRILGMALIFMLFIGAFPVRIFPRSVQAADTKSINNPILDWTDLHGENAPILPVAHNNDEQDKNHYYLNYQNKTPTIEKEISENEVGKNIHIFASTVNNNSSGIISISTGNLHTMAIKDDGSLWGWGNNSNGQLGDNSIINKSSPIQIGSSVDWKSISAGYAHTVAIKSDGCKLPFSSTCA